MKPCLGCGRPTNGSHCPVCRRPTSNRTYADQKHRRETVEVWVRKYGYVCPGYGRPPHPSDDLTADHVVPIGPAGDPLGPLAVCAGRATRGRARGEGDRKVRGVEGAATRRCARFFLRRNPEFHSDWQSSLVSKDLAARIQLLLSASVGNRSRNLHKRSSIPEIAEKSLTNWRTVETAHAVVS